MIHILEPNNDEGWKNCHDPCSTKCFHWIFDKKEPEEQWEHLIKKHPYYFPYAYNPMPKKDDDGNKIEVNGIVQTELVKVRTSYMGICRVKSP